MPGISNGGPLNNQVGTAGAPIDPLLEVLFDNGGFTRTHALKNLSPALETGNSFGLTTDQRGFPRPVNSDSAPPPSTGDDSDIGAFERQNAPAAPSTPDLQSGSDSGTSNSDNITNATPRLFDIPGVTTGDTAELMRGTNPPGGTGAVSGTSAASGPTVAVSRA